MNLVTSTPLKSAIMHPVGGETGRVEFVEWDGLEGRDLSARAVAPNLGILTLRFPVSDAAERASDIVEKGGHLMTKPTTVTMPPYGDVSLFSVTTPDGVFLEFFEPL
jgi:predicted enzyme related to lactoylglutathione lyase